MTINYSENNLTRAKDTQQNWLDKIANVESFFSQHPVQSISGSRNQSIAYWIFPSVHKICQGTILLVQGYTETSKKHDETIYDLACAGFNVVVYDHRGMGFSGRLGKNSQVVHVESFQFYVDDLAILVNDVVLKYFPEKPWYILAHSMGGLVTASFFADEKYRKIASAKAAVLCAPCFELRTDPLPNWFVSLYMTVQKFLGRGAHLVPDRTFIDPTKVDQLINRVTHSPRRRLRQLALYKGVGEALMAGPSQNWVKETIAQTQWLKKQASRIEIPILILSPTSDVFVQTESYVAFCEEIPRCVVKLIPESLHELINEKDPARADVLNFALDFFEHEHRSPKNSGKN